MEDKIDLTKFYTKGDIVYFVRCIERVGVQEVLKLKISTVDTSYFVGRTEKGIAYTIGRDSLHNIFEKLKDANAHLKQISKKAIKDEIDIPSQLIDEFNEEESEDLDSYIDGGEEDK